MLGLTFQHFSPLVRDNQGKMVHLRETPEKFRSSKPFELNLGIIEAIDLYLLNRKRD